MKKSRNLLDELARLGCLFLVTAVESLSNEVLKQLDKGPQARRCIRAFG